MVVLCSCPKTDNPQRKLAYTLELIQVDNVDSSEPTWVGVNTNLPNNIIKLALEKQLFPQLGEYKQIKRRGGLWKREKKPSGLLPNRK